MRGGGKGGFAAEARRGTSNADGNGTSCSNLKAVGNNPSGTPGGQLEVRAGVGGGADSRLWSVPVGAERFTTGLKPLVTETSRTVCNPLFPGRQANVVGCVGSKRGNGRPQIRKPHSAGTAQGAGDAWEPRDTGPEFQDVEAFERVSCARRGC